MNAIERSERRVKRKVVLKRIYEIEMKYCKVCPNRTSSDASACMKCPIPIQLQELGIQLSNLSDRTNVEKIIEEPNVKSKINVEPTYHFARGKLRKKRVCTTPPLTYDQIVEGVSIHGSFARFARSIGISDITVRHRAHYLGLAGLRKAKAREMLRMKEELA